MKVGGKVCMVSIPFSGQSFERLVPGDLSQDW